MTRTLKRVDPISAGKIFGAMYFAMSLIFVPLFAIPMFLLPQPAPAPFGIGLMIAAPILYGLMGFLGACLFAWLYNVFAGRIGGLVVVVSDAIE